MGIDTIRARRVDIELKNLARSGETEGYMKFFRGRNLLRNRRWWSDYLGALLDSYAMTGLPLFTALIVLQETKDKDPDEFGIPSFGFDIHPFVIAKMAEDGYTDIKEWVKLEQKRCFDYFKK
jgi:hypothetical protein